MKTGYLNAGTGLDWAGQVRAMATWFLANICSIATEENLGTELPIGSDEIYVLGGLTNYQLYFVVFHNLLLECFGSQV